MKCRICNKEFNRGTTTLTHNDVCTECHEKYIKVTYIEKPQDVINKEYQDCIDYSLKEIDKLKSAIKHFEDNIEFFKSQIK